MRVCRDPRGPRPHARLHTGTLARARHRSLHAFVVFGHFGFWVPPVVDIMEGGHYKPNFTN